MNGIYCSRGAYAIVPQNDLTEEMLNLMRKEFTVNGGVSDHSLTTSFGTPTKVIVKFKDLSNTVLKSYRWYSYNEILEELKKDEWKNES